MTDASSASVRQLLTREENAEVDDKMLNQFLRATKHDVDKVAPQAWQERCIMPYTA